RLLVDRDPDECEELAVARLDPSWNQHRVCRDPVLAHAVLDEVNPEVDEPAHLDGTTERYFTVTLREVEVPTRQLGPSHVHRIVDAATPGEVLDVVVSSVLTGGNRAGSLPTDSPQVCSGHRPGECTILARGEG